MFLTMSHSLANKILDELGRKSGMLGAIFKKARQDIQNPATLRRLIVELIDTENWSSMQADIKGDIYEGLLAKSAAESPKGAGQYFTPRELIHSIVKCVEPRRPKTPSATRPAAPAASCWPPTIMLSTTTTWTRTRNGI